MFKVGDLVNIEIDLEDESFYHKALGVGPYNIQAMFSNANHNSNYGIKVVGENIPCYRGCFWFDEEELKSAVILTEEDMM